jgi:predicted AlkP superfamily pyrophosphatase or phosphodiesterase
MRRSILTGAVLSISLLWGCMATVKTTQLVLTDTEKTIRDRKDGAPASSPHHAPILFLPFDGVGRDLLYEMLREEQLPELTDLLAGEGENFPHAHFDETLLSTMPSSTMAAWTTTITGLPPAEHGVTGNEFFIREDCRLAAPAPVSFQDAKPTIEIYTDGYLNSLVKVPTVYQRMREREPNILIWVALHQLYTGADRLLFATSTVMAHALEEGLVKTTKKVAKTATLQENPPDRSMFQMLDEDVVNKVESALDDDDDSVPDVLTVYLTGTDLYAHVAEEGPERAQRAYLREVVDPAIGKLADALRDRDALSDRWVVVTSDHGHTPVRNDHKHALYTEGDDSPPGLMKKAGYRVRPFKMKVDSDVKFDAVLTEGGAAAYIYLADRSTCSESKQVCDWRKPPRYDEDVLPLAEALHRNNLDGSLAPRMKGTLDLILTRRPRPFSEKDAPFEVYVGDRKTMPLSAYLAQHPHPTYVEVESRLNDLAVGQYGERAGDIMLLAHNGDRDIPDERYYFASPYRSWHGSPSRMDSEIPFIVASPRFSSQQIKERVAGILGPKPRQQKVTDVLLDLRSDKR